jgi:hypothetical protein
MRDEGRAGFWGALARRDGVAVVEFLSGSPWPEDAPQIIGDGLSLRFRHASQVDGRESRM